MTKTKYSIQDSYRFISAVSTGNMSFVLEVFADNPDAWKWREDRDDDRSVLHHAIAGRQPAMVDLLIRKGAKLELGARHEMRPLMLAAREGDAESVALLLEAGADAAAKDSDGRTALDYSQLRKQGDSDTPRIQKWLVEAVESPSQGRAIKSQTGRARVAQTNEIFSNGAGKPMTASVARFRRKPDVKP
ncbi:MAG TPA: ankyrin repeat domain-containing protein [Patescibacteria group bacterium]|nr:ankyrin repeat domain-containing protein [Patescibacteria group bacterium]